jgi:ABC-type multidrug transport system ATPase subunit
VLTIQLNKVSKKFGSAWVFRNISQTYEAGQKYAITGPNGSGKSTLLKIIAGIITPNEGEVKFEIPGSESAGPMQRSKIQDSSTIYQDISFCSPYMELPEELTLAELLVFHQNLRQLTISAKDFVEELQLDMDKEIRNYSSGMKQRLKLALAFFTDSKAILLDEPSATLDDYWNQWYLKTAERVSARRLLVISSNIPAEYPFCSSVLNLGVRVNNFFGKNLI